MGQVPRSELKDRHPDTPSLLTGHESLSILLCVTKKRENYAFQSCIFRCSSKVYDYTLHRCIHKSPSLDTPILITVDYSHDFVGSALARFERSALPDHKGTKTVVFRFLETITPEKSFSITMLYQRTLGQVWSVNIDTSKGDFVRGL